MVFSRKMFYPRTDFHMTNVRNRVNNSRILELNYRNLEFDFQVRRE
jgi:hypothetical protein